MKDRKLAGRYARALLAALPDAKTRDEVGEFLRALGTVLATSRPVQEALEDPATPRSARLSALQSTAHARNMPPALDAFLLTVVEHGRIAQLPTIGAVYRELLEGEEGVVAATITTAAPLTEDLERRARGAIESMTGKKVRLTTLVDDSLIGGAVTRVGSMVYDGSLRTQLESLRRRMAQE